MKHVLATITLLVYFTVSTGFIVSMHYCMDQFQSVEIGNSHDEQCGLCGMEKDGGCCRDEVKVVKLATTHLLSKNTVPDFSIPSDQILLTRFLFTPTINFPEAAPKIAHGPPPLEEDIFIQIRVFRI